MHLLRLAATCHTKQALGASRRLLRGFLCSQPAASCAASHPACTPSNCSRNFGSKCSSEELAEFRDNVASFAKTSIAIHAEEVDKTNDFPKTVDLWREMGDFGLLGKLNLLQLAHFPRRLCVVYEVTLSAVV